MTDTQPVAATSRGVCKLPLEQGEREGVPRRVFVKGMQGVDVTVVVTVVQGTVWLSISPPFTWEAIMEPGKVDELMHVLELARAEAKRTVAAVHGGGAAREDRAVVRAIRNGSKVLRKS